MEFDYISPHFYVYLVECLLFLVSSCQGRFFTTKSSIVETLACENWIKNSATHSVSNTFVCHDFIARIVRQLLFEWKGTHAWIAKSGVNAKQYYPLLVLQLVIVICLTVLNSGQHLELLCTLLGINDVRSNLPQAFYEILHRGRNHNLANVIAEALQTVENPLVMVYSGNPLGFFSPGAVVLNRDRISSREDIVQVLFLKNPEAQVHVYATEDISSCSTDQGSSNRVSDSSSSTGNGDQNFKIQNEIREDLDLQKQYSSFWDTFDALSSEIQGKHDEVLFLKNPEAQALVDATEHSSSCSTGQGSSNTVADSSSSTGNSDQNFKIQIEIREELDLQKLYSCFWDAVDALIFEIQGKHDEAKSFLANARQHKLKVEESIYFLETTMSQLNQNSGTSNDDISLFGELQSMHGELKQLALALSMSGKELERNMPAIGGILGNLLEKRMKLQPFLDFMYSKKVINASSGKASNGVVDFRAFPTMALFGTATACGLWLLWKCLFQEKRPKPRPFWDFMYLKDTNTSSGKASEGHGHGHSGAFPTVALYGTATACSLWLLHKFLKKRL